MEANCHPFFGLAAEREACIAFRRSRLTLANNFLVGTFFSASRFSFASTQGPLADLEFYLYSQWCIDLRKTFETIENIIDKKVICAALHFEPLFATVRAGRSDRVKVSDRYEKSSIAMWTFKLKTDHILRFDKYTVLGCHFSSLVML